LPPRDVIVLAGDRGPDDPLAREAGVAGKTLVPVAGRAMLARVLATVSRVPGVDNVLVVAPETEGHCRTIDEASGETVRVIRVQPSSSPAASVQDTLDGIPPEREVLLTTGDHPLLESGDVEAFQRGADRAGGDVAVAVVPWSVVARRFPDGRRTLYRCRDGAYCGTNLFLFRTAEGRAVTGIWREVERHRKSPWKVARLLGPIEILRFLARRLTLEQACRRLSARLGLDVRPVVLDSPASAVDVDAPGDLRLAEEALAERDGG